MADDIRIGSGAVVPLHEVASSTGATGLNEVVGRGFSGADSVSHTDDMQVVKGKDGKIPLSPPNFKVSDATPGMLKELDSLKNVNPFNELKDVFSGPKKGEGEDQRTPREKALEKAIQDNISNIGKSKLPPVGELTPKDIQRLQAIDPKELEKALETSSEIFGKVGALEGGPKEVLENIRTKSFKAMNALLSGNVEDAARWLMEIQAELQDTRLKFDIESINLTKLEQKQATAKRITKLEDQMEKLRDAKNMGLFVKIFTYVMLALTYVAAIVAVATPGLQGSAALLVAAAVVMTISVVMDETEMIKDPDIALAISITLAVIGAALTMGAGVATAFAGGTKVAAQAAKTAAEATAKAAAKASAKAAATAAARGASKEVIRTVAKEAALGAAKTIAQETAKNAITSGMKTATKEIIQQATKEAAEQIAKQVAKNVATATIKATAKAGAKGLSKQAVLNLSKTVAEKAATSVIKSSLKSVARAAGRTATQQVRMGRMFRVGQFVRHGTEVLTAVATITQAGLEIKNTFTKKEAADAGVAAKEILAQLAKMQFFMEQLMENIKDIYEQLTSGQEIASDTLKAAMEAKSSIISHI